MRKTWRSSLSGLKSCRKCNELLPLTDFGPYKHSKDRLNYNCRTCWNEIHRDHRKKNLDKIRSYDRDRSPTRTRISMTEEQKIKAKAYRFENREKRLKATKEYQRNNKEAIKIQRKIYAENNKEKIALTAKRSILKKKYNITIEQYDQMLYNQQSVCAICLKSAKGTLHVDHCHTTGKVRELLCTNCNTGIGQLKEDINILTRAMEYLIKHGS